MLAGGFAATLAITVQLLTRGVRWQIDPTLGLLGVYGSLGCWLTAMWRIMRTGLYLSRTGMRVRGPARTTTLPWSEIAAVSAAPAQLLGVSTARHAIWLTLRTGDRVETPVQRQIRTRENQWIKTGGPVLAAREFDQLVELIRRHLTRHNAGP